MQMLCMAALLATTTLGVALTATAQETAAPPAETVAAPVDPAAAPPAAEVVAEVVAAPVEAAAAATEAEPEPVVDKGDVAWMLTSTMLVLLMVVPGLALFYGCLLYTSRCV